MFFLGSMLIYGNLLEGNPSTKNGTRKQNMRRTEARGFMPVMLKRTWMKHPKKYVALCMEWSGVFQRALDVRSELAFGTLILG